MLQEHTERNGQQWSIKGVRRRMKEVIGCRRSLGQTSETQTPPPGSDSALVLVLRCRERNTISQRSGRGSSPASRFLPNQSTVVAISFPSRQNEEICSFICNQWQMSVWPEHQSEQKVGCALSRVYLWKLMETRFFYFYDLLLRDFCSYE